MLLLLEPALPLAILGVGLSGGDDNNPIDVMLESTQDADCLEGDPGADFINGQAGDDVMNDHAGNDTIFGREGKDGDQMLYSGDGGDVVTGDVGRDFIEGQGDDDFVSGDYGRYTVRGDEGDDTVLVGRGSDVVEWNDGDDLFIGLGDWVGDGVGSDAFHVMSEQVGKRGAEIIDYNRHDDAMAIIVDDVNAVADISVTDDGADTVIRIGNNVLALVRGTDGTLTAADVTLISKMQVESMFEINGALS